MRRPAIVSLLVGAPLAALIFWIASHTYWADTQVPMPLKGEARINPFYAAQRFAEALGARTTWDRVLTTPSTNSVVVLSAWNWDLSTGRRKALEQWVESGGRLVVDDTMFGGEEFERWSGIVRDYVNWDNDDDVEEPDSKDRCREIQEQQAGDSYTRIYRVCDLDGWSFLKSSRNAAWTLRDAIGIQAMRIPVGRGSVTVVNTDPFRYRNLFDGDHGWLLVAATQVRRGDDVHFLSEDDHPSLLALTWQHGGPVVVLVLTVIALVLWRGWVRFGPLAAPTPTARRSLAVQIRGTGQFALRTGDSAALHAASVRALNEAAPRRIPGYASLPAGERARAVARVARLEWHALATALHHPRLRGPNELGKTIALVETARRRTSTKHTGSSHGTDSIGRHR